MSFSQKDSFFDPTKENLAYTLGIIKPDTCFKQQNIQNVINILESQGFIIKNMLQRELMKEEIMNLYYKHVKKPYFEEILNYLLGGESVIFLLCHETEDPIAKWKKMIGPSDPVEAKKSDPDSLRAKFGVDRIRNEFHGSDSPYEANKERDIFKFPIPQKIPDFSFNKFKVTIDYLWKFLFPPNLEHPNVNQRLDLFAIYGPVLNHHSIDQCFCYNCTKIVKEHLEQEELRKLTEEKRKMGLLSKNEQKTRSLTSTSKKIPEKIKVNPIRLINEDGLSKIYQQLCEKCQIHCDSYTHLCGGRDMQHVLTDAEIKCLGAEMNKKELLELLTIEKGNAAKIMIEDVPTDEPKDLVLSKELIQILFKNLKTDYYNRYEFNDLQQVILEDRRIRMMNWISWIVKKPLERFKNPKLVDPTISKKERNDVKSINFTLTRKLPLTLTYKKKEISYTPVEFPHSIIDKPKLSANEENMVVLKKLHRNSHHLADISEVNKPHFATSIMLLRNYNEGRNGAWNNYACLKGVNKGSFVKKEKFTTGI